MRGWARSLASPVSPARKAAFELLLELKRKPESHSDLLLRSQRVEALSALDKNLATTLVMGVLRWQLVLQQRIAAALTKRRSHLADPVQVSLELGALQLLVLDRIPARAAIFESVELVRQSGSSYAVGLVNALLRKLDHAFASLLKGEDSVSGETLPGLENGRHSKGAMSRTDMVRCKSLVEATRVQIVEVMSKDGRKTEEFGQREPHILPRLRSMWFEGVEFWVHSSRSEGLLEFLCSRVEFRPESAIQELHLKDCWYLYERDVDRMKEAVHKVEWDEVEQEEWDYPETGADFEGIYDSG